MKVISPNISLEESTSVGEYQNPDVTEITQCTASEKRSQNLIILIILPQKWSIKKIKTKFGTTTYVARKTKNLDNEET